MAETVSEEGPRRSWPAAGVRAAAALIGVTAGLYAAWLGWDQEMRLDPTTLIESGPYETWQIVGLVLCLGAVAVIAGWRGRTVVCLVLLPPTLAICFAIDAATDSTDQGLWPVAAVLMPPGAFVGTVAATFAGVIARELLARRRGPAWLRPP